MQAFGIIMKALHQDSGQQGNVKMVMVKSSYVFNITQHAVRSSDCESLSHSFTTAV